MNKQLATLTLGILLSGATAMAQTTAQDGLNKLKSNMDNSKANLEEYQRNLKIVENNVAEIAKAKSQLDGQKVTVTKAVEENNKNLQVLVSKEKELNAYIKGESSETMNEDKKIAELEKALAQLKANKAKRGTNTTSYQEQLKQISKERAEWQARGDQLAKTQKELDDRAKSLSAQEAEWKGKLRGYQGEVSRWQKELERQKKLNDNYSSLSEVRD